VSELEPITKTERTELGNVVRRNFRVAKAGIDEQKARVLADFEAAMAKQWDPVELACKELYEDAQTAVERINKRIAEQFAELGLPKEWSPRAAMWWNSRGENTIPGRRAELRKQAQTRAEAEARSAKLELDRREAEILLGLASTALTSSAAQAFLSRIPSLEALMPAIEVEGPPLEAVSALLGRRQALSEKRALAGRAGGRATRKQLASLGEQFADEEPPG
jgi:hypothetical protein